MKELKGTIGTTVETTATKEELVEGINAALKTTNSNAEYEYWLGSATDRMQNATRKALVKELAINKAQQFVVDSAFKVIEVVNKSNEVVFYKVESNLVKSNHGQYFFDRNEAQLYLDYLNLRIEQLQREFDEELALMSIEYKTGIPEKELLALHGIGADFEPLV